MHPGNSLVVQWLGLSTSTALVQGSAFGQGTKISQALLCSQKRTKPAKGREAHTREWCGRVPNSKLLLFPPWTPPRRQNTSPSVYMAHWFLNRQSTANLGSAHALVSRAFIGLPYGGHGDSDGKASAYNAGDPGSILGSGRSPGEENGNPLQYSCLENPLDGGAW